MPKAMNSTVLSFGLVNIPIKVYKSASTNTIPFNRLHPDTLNRIKQKLVDAETGKEVQQKDCKRGFEYEKGSKGSYGKSIEITDQDLDSASSLCATKGMEIEEFISADQLPELAINETFFLGPDKNAEKVYILFSSILEDQNLVAIARWTSRGKTKLVAVKPYNTGTTRGLIMNDLFYSDEVRSFNEVGLTDSLSASPEEIMMAKQLIGCLYTKSFDFSKYKNQYAEKLNEIIDLKISGKALPQVAAAPKPSSNLFDALKASLAAMGTKTDSQKTG